MSIRDLSWKGKNSICYAKHTQKGLLPAYVKSKKLWTKRRQNIDKEIETIKEALTYGKGINIKNISKNGIG